MNDRERFELAASIFLEAAQLSSGERGAFLDRRCGEDAALRELVDGLLQSREGSVFRSLAEHLQPVHERLRERADDDTTLASGSRGILDWVERNENPDDEIGRFRLLELIGEGGFGRVWVAEQREPVQRRVALKVIKAGMDTREVVARFEQERQALALMDHPNIAKVFDAGVTDSGRPYFVMELCKGESIATYCDLHSLSIKDRLDLFAQVCTAVHHAHTKGVIHRDIKPSNVLVSTQDGRPHAKIIDFGIAKAVDTRLTTKTLFTEHRQLIGTPAYMSPEQAEGSLDIDTRSDVYSLGVLLYELLTGSTPFTGKELLSAAFGEMQRIIREVEPPKPSTRLSQNAGTLANIAASRNVEPHRLGTIIRGELDWIVMKALEKDRARRYESASGLADDVRRYLAGEPVTAAPPSRAYRVRKFIRRHRGFVVASTVIAVSLVLGVIGTSIGLIWALREESHAARAALAEAAARRAEAQRADELQKVSDFQVAMLRKIDVANAGFSLMRDIREKFSVALNKSDYPDADRPKRIDEFEQDLNRVNATDVAAELIDETILKPAVSAVDSQFKDQPLLDSAMRHTLAEIYGRLARFDAASELLVKALDVRQRELGDADPLTLTSMLNMGRLLRMQGKFPEGERVMREAVESSRRTLGDDDPLTLRCVHTLGLLFRDAGKLADAEACMREAVDRGQRVLSPEDPDLLNYIEGLGIVLGIAGRRPEGAEFLREAMERSRVALRSDQPLLASKIGSYGLALLELGRWTEAESYIREGLELMRRVRGEEHPQTLLALNNLAYVLDVQHRLPEAESIYREVAAKTRRALGDNHPDLLRALNNLGNILRSEHKYDEAEPVAREAMEGYRRVLGPEHRDTLIAMNVYGYLLMDLKRTADAEPYWREAYETGRRVLGEDHPDVIIWTSNLANLLRIQGKLDEAEPLLRDSLAKTRRVNGADHPTTIGIIARMANFLRIQKKYDDAEVLFREALVTRRRVYGNDNIDTLNSIYDLAGILRKTKKLDEAEQLYREALAGYARVKGENCGSVLDMMMGLAGLHMDQERWAESAAELTSALDVFAKASDALPVRRRQCIEGLIEIYDNWQKSEPDHGHDAKAAEWRDALRKLDEAPSSSNGS